MIQEHNALSQPGQGDGLNIQTEFARLLNRYKMRFADQRRQMATQEALETKEYAIKRPKYGAITQAHLMHALDHGRGCYELHFFLNETVQMKGPRAFVILRALQELGQIIYADPCLEDIQADKELGPVMMVTLDTPLGLEKLAEVISRLSEVDAVRMLDLSAA